MVFLIIGGIISELIGRKRTLITGQICLLGGWIIIYFSKQFPMLLFGRFIIGLGSGIILPVITLQLSEIALIKMRGTISMMSYLIMNIGNIYILLVSTSFTLNGIISMSAVPTIVFLLTSLFLPESPMWLVKKGHTEKAKNSLLKLRGSKYQMNDELKELENLVKSQGNTSLMEKLKELKSRSNAIPFLILTTICVLQVYISEKLIHLFLL